MKYSIVDGISLFVVKKLISMMDEENIVNDILRNPIDNITRPGSILISTSRKHNEELRKWVAIVSTPITRDYLYELIDLRCKVDERYSGNHKRDKEEIIDRYWDEINDESTYDGSTAMDRCISYFSRRVEWNEEQINKINNACRFMDDEYGTDKSSKDSDKIFIDHIESNIGTMTSMELSQFGYKLLDLFWNNTSYDKAEVFGDVHYFRCDDYNDLNGIFCKCHLGYKISCVGENDYILEKTLIAK